jgi:hypothetical protein
MTIYSRKHKYQGRFGKIAKILDGLIGIELNRDNENIQTSATRKSYFALLYLGFVIVVFANLIATFYLSLIDVVIILSNNEEGLISSVNYIVIQDPFHGGWLGSLPWYSSYPLPLFGANTFHEDWEWILFTGIGWENFVFLENIIEDINLFLLTIGVVFLLPLGIKAVRESFIPALLHFMSGILIIFRGIFGLFGESISVLYFGNTLDMGYVRYGVEEIGIERLTQITFFSFSAIIIGIVFFSIVGHFLWKSHLKTMGISSKWFLVFLSASYFSSLFAIMW